MRQGFDNIAYGGFKNAIAEPGTCGASIHVRDRALVRSTANLIDELCVNEMRMVCNGRHCFSSTSKLLSEPTFVGQSGNNRS